MCAALMKLSTELNVFANKTFTELTQSVLNAQSGQDLEPQLEFVWLAIRMKSNQILYVSVS